MKYTSLSAMVLLLLPLIGAADVPVTEIDKERILDESQEWKNNYDSQRTSEALIKELKSKLGAGFKIDIYLGLWCPDSRNNVPPFLKILDEIGTGVEVHFFSVPRKPAKSIQYYVDRVQIERVPTFVFYRDRKEIGRIIENPSKGLAEDMLEIISK